MSDHSRDPLTHAPRRLPDIALPTPSGATHRLRASGRRSPVLVLPHAAACDTCAAFLRHLAAAGDALRAWDADVLVIAPAPAERVVDVPFPLLLDPDRRVPSSLGVRAPAVIIADQWGEVHEIVEAGEEHRFPSAAEIEKWAQYLAIHCPECQGEAL